MFEACNIYNATSSHGGAEEAAERLPTGYGIFELNPEDIPCKSSSHCSNIPTTNFASLNCVCTSRPKSKRRSYPRHIAPVSPPMPSQYSATARATLDPDPEVSYLQQPYLISKIGTGIIRTATQPTSVDAQRGFRARNNAVENSGNMAPNMLRMTVHAPSAEAAAYE
ncbi:hypothetical protein BD310DRAFT_910021 [Dichomitus squalens]|uniref:Uncharacterized protein n=1 Tax=Dichomitus squalens TaxID=114155 RepID=A0A4Q9PCL2_9APHY|nr:hypothetical protein BD310DRAFT_910021 [Dichomitus squalens]